MTDADEFLAQQREGVRRFLADNGLPQVARTLAGLAQPSIRRALQRIEPQDVAVGVSAASFSAGAAIGPLVGGLLLEHF